MRKKLSEKKKKKPWEIISRFLRGRERRKAAAYVSVFCQNLGITALH